MNAELIGPPLTVPEHAPATLSHLLLRRARQFPESRFAELDRAGTRQSVTVASLHRRALGILGNLHEQTPTESHLVLCFERVLDAVPAIWAAVHGGYSCLPWQLHRHVAPDEVQTKLALFAAKLTRPILITTAAVLERLSVLGFQLPFAATIIIDASEASEEEHLISSPRADASFLIMTSGATGTSKIAIIPHACLLNRFFIRVEQALGKNRIFCFPFDSVTGLWVIFPAAADNIYVQPDRFAAQPLDLLEAISSFSVSGLSLSTSMAVRLLEAIRRDDPAVDLGPLESIGFGGEMIAAGPIHELGRELERMGAPNLKLGFGYGMTETGPICAGPRMSVDELAVRLHQRGGQSSVGIPNPSWSLRIVDDEGAPRSGGIEGNIEVRSATNLFAGYLNDPELTRQSFTADGWFKTGDLGVIEEGALKITGRRKSVIIINAKKISLESIEAPLQRLDGIRKPFAAAVAIRTLESATDELGIFFVAEEGVPLDELCRDIVRVMGRERLAVSHLVPLREEQFPLTSTGKAKRNELASLYQSGSVKPHPLPNRRRKERSTLNDTERWLAGLWRSILDLDFNPDPEDDFIALGADSFASAELIFAVEERFSCSLPVGAFFERPTIASLAALIEVRKTALAAPAGGATPSPSTDRVLHRIQAYVARWKGHRLFEDSLVVGYNMAGKRPPILWVCQGYDEAKALAASLGSNQPLYAMRSCVRIVKIRDYTTEVIETVCDRYLWEILALGIGKEFVIGGNCQGGILALAMARRLNQIGRKPLCLVLVEWLYAYGVYAEPSLLIWADQSAAAKIFTQFEGQKINWRRDFPRGEGTLIPGRHGAIFSDKVTLASLVKLLSRQTGDNAGIRAAWARFRAGLDPRRSL